MFRRFFLSYVLLSLSVTLFLFFQLFFFVSLGQEGGYAAVVVGLMARNRLLFR
jgi:hypothetical protein